MTDRDRFVFDIVRPLTPSTVVVTDEDLDRIEQTFVCTLPEDYRSFVKHFGPGAFDRGSISILAPEAVIEETEFVRTLFAEPVEDPRGRLFDYYDNAPDLLAPEDIGRLICIGSNSGGDYFVLLPGAQPHYFELPHSGEDIYDDGTTMDSFLVALDPRRRFAPMARLIIEHGVARILAGQPDKPYTLVFTPEGHELVPQGAGSWQIEWDDGGPIRWDESRAEIGYGLAAVRFHIDHHPLLALLEMLALRDPTLSFEAVEADRPEAYLTVPRFQAELTLGARYNTLFLVVQVPHEHQEGLYRWLASEAHKAKCPVPPDLRTFISD